ncbi:MAG: C69 family dipeptidase [Prevotella sp.]|nr:C69 family dipeptidase [Prevotella sp.]
MKRLSLFLLLLIIETAATQACTNIIVTAGASADGSVMCSYNADSYGAFNQMLYFPAAKHAAGETRPVIDWDTKRPWGEIPEAAETCKVLGNINEYQVAIGETTFGGREEMVDSTGLMDYGSLIYIALQRSKTAREAISTMTSLAEKYGYNSEGETFSICDSREAWIMEMMGQGAGSKKVVWAAIRIPDGAVCAHANQSRIRTFDKNDKENVMVSADCIEYARRMGWYSGRDEDFSFRDAYCAPDFSGRRYCEARVWAIFNHLQDMSAYVDYAAGIKPLSECEEMPMWIFPERKISVRDVENMMRDHYEGTPFALDGDLGEGIWQMPYRPTPLSFKLDGKEYFNERPVSTQQTSFTFVVQLRSYLPRQIGGIIWFGNDDANMVPFVPVYCCNNEPPKCFNDPVADDVTFSDGSAFWVSNWVSNMVYPRYSQMFGAVEKERDRLDSLYAARQAEIETEALRLYKENADAAVAYLTDYSNGLGDDFMDTWHRLARYLIVKYNDMVEKPEDGNGFLRTQYGAGESVVRTGYPERTARRIAESTGGKFLMPEE